MRARTIQYAIDLETGLVFSFYGDEAAIPVLDFEGMNVDNGWKQVYNLERFPRYDAFRGTDLYHTRKIPVWLKNTHRRFWGMPCLTSS